MPKIKIYYNSCNKTIISKETSIFENNYLKELITYTERFE